MTNSTGVVVFNGKQVDISYSSGWGDPGQWFISFDNKSELAVEDARGAHSQAEYIKTILPQAERGNKFAKQLIQDIFSSDWEKVGVEEDVIRIALNYVGYNMANKDEDMASILATRVSVATKLRTIADYVESEEYDSDVLADQLLIVNGYYNIEVEPKNGLAVGRIGVFDKLSRDKHAGNEWTTASFYATTADLELIAKIEAVLAEPLKP